MFGFIKKYTHWLHTQWPAGKVEKLPQVREDGATNRHGVRIVGDLTGIPLLKFSGDTGTKAVRAFLKEADFKPSRDEQDDVLDLAVVGGGVSGIAAALEARKQGLTFKVIEAAEPFQTIRGFPKRKPIFTYPTEMTPEGEMQFASDVKEDLIEELESQRKEAGIVPLIARIQKIERQDNGVFGLRYGDNREHVIQARRVVVAIGRSGNYRKLDVPGEDKNKVSHRLFDPAEFEGKKVLVVGGGDSALESTISLVEAGAEVTLSYRKKEFSRPKPGNLEKLEILKKTGDDTPGRLRMLMASEVKEIHEDSVVILKKEDKGKETIENEQVFTMIGREPPLDFFRRSGLALTGEWTSKVWVSLISFLAFIILFYHWQKGMWFTDSLSPKPLASWLTSMGGFFQEQSNTPGHLLHVLKHSALSQPGFYYSLAYCLCVAGFGLRRIKRRNTPYVKLQTWTLAAIQIIPLFLLPWILLPWMGQNGWFDAGVGRWIGDTFWPDESYWRAFGLVLAWPLFIYNWFTSEPIWGWLVLGFLQTFVIIPLIIYRWGKGAYCGWICSCGALAETMGDAHRHKMPHGPFWNKLNMLGQVILWVAMLMMLFRIIGWIWPASVFNTMFDYLFSKTPIMNYKYVVDFWLAGVLGVGLYFHFSGRMWCRFACPLAALMHIYTRFSRFRIFSDKKKCISCNVCTSVCHQGIDVMSFANKGRPMEDPECVRCSACVQSCPTGVLSFGRYDHEGGIILDKIAASQVQMREQKQVQRD